MITEKISEIAVQILDATGYAGAAGLMALESMIFPLPSEAVMPFVEPFGYSYPRKSR